MDDSLTCMSIDGLMYCNSSSPSSQKTNDSPTTKGVTLNKSNLSILQSFSVAGMTEKSVISWEQVKAAYKVTNGVSLDDKELIRLFSISDVPQIISTHFPEFMICLADGSYQLNLLPGHNLKNLIDRLTSTTTRLDTESASNLDTKSDSGYSGFKLSSPSSCIPSSASSTQSAGIYPLRSINPTLTNVFHSLEEVKAMYAQVCKDRKAHKTKFYGYIYKKSAEFEANKKAEIAAIEVKYKQKMANFSKFIDQRLETVAAMEADDDAFFEAQLRHFVNP